MREIPALPAGWSKENARLEMRTEFLDCPEPRAIDRGSVKSMFTGVGGVPVVDQLLDFGSMGMLAGKAFGTSSLSGQETVADPPVMVAKAMEEKDGRRVLRESISAEELSRLGDGMRQARLEKSGGLLPQSGLWLEARARQEALRPMQLASRPLEKGGVVLDYVTVTGTTNSYTFTNGSTYRVAGTFWLQNGLTINGGAVVKFNSNATLCVSGTLTCNSTAANKAIFTSFDDSSVGEQITATETPPSGYYANKALNVYNGASSTVIKGLEIRYAQYGIYDYSPYYTHTLQDCLLVGCQYGATVYYTTLSLSSLYMCNVSTPMYNAGYGYWSGSPTTTGWTCGTNPTPAQITEAHSLANAPHLINGEWSVTGGGDYNCIAWSVGITNRWFTPLNIDLEFGNGNGILELADMDAFYLAKKNWTPSASGPSDALAMYYPWRNRDHQAIDADVNGSDSVWSGFHAAVSRTCACGNGLWFMFESKLGGGIRIEHPNDGVNSYCSTGGATGNQDGSISDNDKTHNIYEKYI